MIVGDFLVHQQEDGRVALHDLETWRYYGKPIRFFDTLDEAKATACGEPTGGAVWFSHWQAPDKIMRL